MNSQNLQKGDELLADINLEKVKRQGIRVAPSPGASNSIQLNDLQARRSAAFDDVRRAQVDFNAAQAELRKTLANPTNQNDCNNFVEPFYKYNDSIVQVANGSVLLRSGRRINIDSCTAISPSFGQSKLQVGDNVNVVTAWSGT